MVFFLHYFCYENNICYELECPPVGKPLVKHGLGTLNIAKNQILNTFIIVYKRTECNS